MNKRIANIARMLRTTGNVLSQNQEKWATLAVLAATVPGFLKMVEKIAPAQSARKIVDIGIRHEKK